MATITITEALNQLKNINARIIKETDNATLVSTYQIGRAPDRFKSVEEFESTARAAFQSITDLIERRNKIKVGIVSSNAITNVIIGGQSYTVAGAIEYKSSIGLKNNVLRTLLAQSNKENGNKERAAAQVQARLDNLIEQNLGKDVKSNPEDVKNITDAFMARNDIKLADPLNSKLLIDKMSREIDDFLSNVDTQLSISNATTFIEV